MKFKEFTPNKDTVGKRISQAADKVPGVAGARSLSNFVKSAFKAGQASKGGIGAAVSAYDKARDRSRAGGNKPTVQKTKSTTPAATAPKQKKKSVVQSYLQLQSGDSFRDPKSETVYIWNKDKQAWVGEPSITPEQGVKMLNRASAKGLASGPTFESKQKCKEGEYYCNEDKKCKPIPTGYKMDSEGWLVKEAAGARIQHAEDLIFWEGSQGAKRAIESLRNLAKGGHKDVTIKWDGSPAIIFGRDENGEFILTDKSGFIAKGYDGKARSADDLEQMLLSRGKNKDKTDAYKAFAGRMKSIFDDVQKAIPEDFKGFLKGDLLYFDTPQKQGNNYVFKPNVVEYAVDVNSDLGKRIGESKVGVVIHRYQNLEGNETPVKAEEVEDRIKGKTVLILPPVSIEDAPEVDETSLNNLNAKVTRNAAMLDKLLDKNALRANKMTDFSEILYTYLNSKVDSGLETLGKDFIKWLDTSKVSRTKQAKIIEYIKANMQPFAVLWDTVKGIMQVKDNIIAQLDAKAGGVKSSIGGQAGGEGYVLASPQGDIKLVSRQFFTRANRAVKREQEENMKVKDLMKEADFDDLGLKGVGAELDRDDEEPGFKNQPMIVQVMKVIDSLGNPNPIKTVKTDDDKELPITGAQAKTIKMLATSEKVKPATRNEFVKDIQMSNGLKSFLDEKEPKDMVQKFIDMYMGDASKSASPAPTVRYD